MDINKDINKEAKKEEMGYITIPVVTYMLEKEMVERRESRLYKIIISLIVALFLTAILVTGGFLLYMNQYDFETDSYEVTQDVDSGEYGFSEISDGVHISKN